MCKKSDTVGALVHTELWINHSEYKYVCSASVFMFLFEGFEVLNIRSKIEAISLKALTKLASSS